MADQMAGGRDASDQRSPVGVVLAAGRGVRFGGPKQLAVLAGQPLVAHAVATLATAGLPVVVVVGPRGRGTGPAGAPVHGDQGAVADAARSAASDVRIVVNADPSRGMGSSLAAAVAEVGPCSLVVLLADQPRVSVADVEAVVGALDDGAEAVQVTFRDGGRGHPVGFGEGLHDRLLVLAREGGGRALLAEVGPTLVPVDHDRPRDVDTRDDLAALVVAAGGAGGAGDAPARPADVDTTGEPGS